MYWYVKMLVSQLVNLSLFLSLVSDILYIIIIAVTIIIVHLTDTCSDPTIQVTTSIRNNVVGKCTLV